MRIKKFAATALLAISAVAITGGTAYAEPATAASEISATPVALALTDDGIDYTILQDGRGPIVTTLANGIFTLTDEKLTVTNSSGAVVASAPLTLDVQGEKVSWQPKISNDGRTLTADPVAANVNAPQITGPSAPAIGLVVGAIAGMLVGLVLGMFTLGLLMPITLIVGFVAGAIIGFTVGMQQITPPPPAEQGPPA
ncbi:hypothetical protein [Nocardia sp. NPDC051832]|uniref:hypothetical protein n=1 Tax=Nocardia sp. NPDC051832 TaxID=3155673 RepID=UPI003419FE54